jgi:hypothetical protein
MTKIVADELFEYPEAAKRGGKRCTSNIIFSLPLKGAI